MFHLQDSILKIGSFAGLTDFKMQVLIMNRKSRILGTWRVTWLIPTKLTETHHHISTNEICDLQIMETLDF